MKNQQPQKISLLPIEKINILNPRVRNKKIFDLITDNISQVGLKKPITVTPCKSGAADKEYDLVCGQGRLEAFIARGQTHIPAIIIDASEEQALIMSLVENLARRQYRAIDLLQGIEILQKQGYDYKVIAKKTGLVETYVDAVLKLLERGEARLLCAVEAGQIPITIAMTISDTPEEGMQEVLQEIYNTKQLRGSRLILAKKLIEKRRFLGKAMHSGSRTTSKSGTEKISVHQVMKVYQKEVDRKRLLTRKADIASNRLLFIVEALRRLFQEEHFNVLLQAEEIATLPKPLSDLLAAKGKTHA
ncbi:MAG: plasmid partitioning protein RepB C-terminal domain-containing protein [Micavibrio sp.]|nr:plasmid partitioning protein RepB C-terminal domain-containing protein [Micavibrio sp.]